MACTKVFKLIIRERCSVAYYVPYTAHSLNLVGKCATEGCPAAVGFFLYYSKSDWLHLPIDLHRKHLRGLPVTNALSDTRWSTRHDAVRAVNKGYNENMSALEELLTNEYQPRDSRLEAEVFLKKLQQLGVAILLELWDTL